MARRVITARASYKRGASSSVVHNQLAVVRMSRVFLMLRAAGDLIPLDGTPEFGNNATLGQSYTPCIRPGRCQSQHVFGQPRFVMIQAVEIFAIHDEIGEPNRHANHSAAMVDDHPVRATAQWT